MKLKSLYEGILSDMEDTIQAGDNVADEFWLNQEDSPMRKMFGRGNVDKEPFSIITTDRKTIHCNAPGTVGAPFNIDCDQKLSDIIKGVDNLTLIGGCTLFGEGNTVVTDKTLCSQLTADVVYIHGIAKLDGINMDVKQIRDYAKFIPQISVDGPISEIANCRLEVAGQNSKIAFTSAPKLTNVSSNTVNFIEIKNRAMTAADWHKLIFNNLFEFGYDLSVIGLRDTTTVKINKMSDLVKLIASKNFYGSTYSEHPYRLKRGAKLSDIFDVSKFKALKRVAVWGNRSGLIFENVKNGCNTAEVFGSEVLRQYYANHPSFNRNDYNDGIPVTADGWRVFMVRV